MNLALLALAAVRWLPTPFTADQIREAMPAGTCLTLQVDPAPGQPGVTIVWRVEHATLTHMTWLTSVRPQGGDWDEPTPARARWTSLQRHARFDARRATRSRDTLDTPFGALDGWRYEVQRSDGAVDVFTFADAMPGPPVRRIHRAADGSTATTSLVARGPCPSG
jgi:hypothetical protein